MIRQSSKNVGENFTQIRETPHVIVIFLVKEFPF